MVRVGVDLCSGVGCMRALGGQRAGVFPCSSRFLLTGKFFAGEPARRGVAVWREGDGGVQRHQRARSGLPRAPAGAGGPQVHVPGCGRIACSPARMPCAAPAVMVSQRMARKPFKGGHRSCLIPLAAERLGARARIYSCAALWKAHRGGVGVLESTVGARPGETFSPS